MQKPSAGSVAWSGRELGEMRGRELARLRAFVPQRMPVPAGVSVREAVTIGRSSHLRPLRRLTGERPRRGRAGDGAGRGSTRFAERDLTTLSGGELQRVQIAIGLAQEAPVLIADEPTSQLDLGATIGVAGLLRELVGERPGGAAGRPRPGPGGGGRRHRRRRLRGTHGRQRRPPPRC